MLSALGFGSMEMACRLRRGGVIINEHTLSGAQTRHHVDVLSRWFDFVSLADLPGRLAAPRSRPFCLLTFDDGKRSNATETAGELERLGVPAVFFVVTGFLSDGKPLWFDRYRALQRSVDSIPHGLGPDTIKRLPYDLLIERLERTCREYGVDAQLDSDDVKAMTWDQARDLHRRGFAVGAHGVTHAILTRETRSAALDSIQQSIARVSEELGSPCRSFAFPNGNYTAELALHAIRCGVETVMTTEPAWADQHFPLWRLPRLQLFEEDSRGKIELKLGLAATGRVLANPDGTGRLYRRFQ